MKELDLSNVTSKFTKPAVLESRAFQSGLIGMIITCLIYYIPELEPYRGELPDIIMVITVSLVARFTYSNKDGNTVEVAPE